MLQLFFERPIFKNVFLNLGDTIMLSLLHLKDLEFASTTLHQCKITLSYMWVQFLSRNSCITAFIRTKIRWEIASCFMFFDLRKVKHFFTSKLFILALDSKSFLNSILHKFVDLKEFRVRNISSAFVWTFLRFFDTRLAIVLSAMLALRRCFQDVVA